MPRIKRNTILDYVPLVFEIETKVNSARIFELNTLETKNGDIIYLCERNFRVNDNFALNFALEKIKEFNKNLKIIYQQPIFNHSPKSNFISKQIKEAEKCFKNANLNFTQVTDVQKFLKENPPSILILDFNPILNRNWLKNLPCKIYEIDSSNIIPARFVSNKQEYSASTFRPKIYQNIYPFLKEIKPIINYKTEAENVLEDFIKNKLDLYAGKRNDPAENCLSGLSKYLNLGFISSQRVAVEIIKSNSTKENKEAFLEELIIRKELSDNFCLYSKDFKTLNKIPDWAKNSLEMHSQDIREYQYSFEEMEQAYTHDILWNATQRQLIKTGVIQSYLRMYWAKKILEWSATPKIALKNAILLNDKYAFDSPSTNGYVGILWAIGGLHDRAFQDWKITGKIRRMTYKSLSKKFDVSKYISTYS